MPKAYIIARSAISYRRYITRDRRNGYHCKKPLLPGRQKRFFTWWRRGESICIFVLTDKNRGSARSSPRAQQPTGLLHFARSTHLEPEPKIAASAASQAFCAAKPWRRANSFRPSMPNCPWGGATKGSMWLGFVNLHFCPYGQK